VAEQPEQRPLAIVDLDGVVADVRHRLRHIERRPKDWDAFFDAAPDDPPHPEGIAVVQRLEQDHEVVYLTGRPERCRDDTLRWLDEQGIGGHELLMRSRRDRRPAATVKVEVLRRRARQQPVGIVVDDDDLVVAAMRKAGYPVLHADWEARDAAVEAALQRAQEEEGRT
jgi:hypothetical protein